MKDLLRFLAGLAADQLRGRSRPRSLAQSRRCATPQPDARRYFFGSAGGLAAAGAGAPPAETFPFLSPERSWKVTLGAVLPLFASQVEEKVERLSLDIAQTEDGILRDLAEVVHDRLRVVD